jgi:subtilisin-like proprotein convertase family protein
VWCAFPSSDFEHAPFGQLKPLTTGIWTIDRSGTSGYNTGTNADGDAAGMFTNSFGGTSSACPGAAGVAALVLSVNPALKSNEVKDLLKRACDRIDPQGGEYDAAGHSTKYGYGRLNARTAVDLASPQPRNEVTVNRRFDGPIPDLQTVTFTLNVPDRTPVEAISAGVDLKHTYVGDLVITLEPPTGIGAPPITLHNRAGGSGGAIKLVYDKMSVPGLVAFAGKPCNGTWTLRIRDAAARDAGTLLSFSLRLSFPHPERAVASPPPAERTARRKKPARRSARVVG